MKLITLSIKRRVTVTMLYLIIVGFGIFSLTQLKLAMTPDLEFPQIIVSTSYSGVSPEDMENLVTRPVEEAVSSTEGVVDVSSESSEGASLVTLEFDWGSDMNQAEIDVRNSLDQARDTLPDDANEPVVMALNTSQFPVMFLTLTSENLGPAALRKLGEDRIEPLLERVSGVAMVSTIGGLERQINVTLDPVLLASYNLSPLDVKTAIQSGSGLTASGSIEGISRDFNLRVYSEYRTLDQIRNTVVTSYDGEPVTVDDVADVIDGYEDIESDVRINKAHGIVFLVTKQSDANTVQTCRNVTRALPDIEAVLPADTNINVLNDSSEFIGSSINNLKNTAYISFIIAVLIIYIFLRDWRGSLTMGISILISIIFTFSVLMLADMTLNIISLAGLALAIGMLVDNSVVVLENAFRHKRMGESSVESADSGASEVAMAITASTITTVCVFLPVLFVPGITSELLGDLVLTITFSLLVSLIVALTLLPMILSHMLSGKSGANAGKNASREGLYDRVVRLYRRVLHWSLNRKTVVVVSVLILFAFSVSLYPRLGGNFMPSTDQGRISFSVECRAGIPLEQLRQVVMQCEQIIEEEVPEVENMMFRFGAEENGFGPNTATSNTISATIMLPDVSERTRGQAEVQNAIRARLESIPGITYTVQMMSLAGASENDIELQIFGDDLDQVEVFARDIMGRMREMEGLVDVNLNISQHVPLLSVDLDYDMLNDFGLTHLQVANIISSAIQGATAAYYHEEGDEYSIYVQLKEESRDSKESLENLLIAAPSGAMVPLRQLGSIVESISPQTIYRENQERYIAIEANVSDIDLASAVDNINQMLSEVQVPSDFTILIGGGAEDQQEAFFYLMIAVIVAIVLVYMVMASQFESLVDPFTIMFTVPLSIIGVILFLLITDTTLNVMALIGIVMLVGIAVNNGIVMVDYINQLRDTGKELYESVEEGGATRLRPVLMTSLTTIFGMMPMAFELGSGAEMWTPLARAVIGGISVATLLTLVFIPVMYVIFEELGQKVNRMFNLHGMHAQQ